MHHMHRRNEVAELMIVSCEQLATGYRLDVSNTYKHPIVVRI
jgi:hypothetical protein